MIKEISARITVFFYDGSEEDIVVSADSWEHLMADINLHAVSEKEKEDK